MQDPHTARPLRFVRDARPRRHPGQHQPPGDRGDGDRSRPPGEDQRKHWHSAVTSSIEEKVEKLVWSTPVRTDINPADLANTVLSCIQGAVVLCLGASRQRPDAFRRGDYSCVDFDG